MYRDKEIKKEFKGKGIQDEEVLLFKPYKKSTKSNTKSSFIQNEVKKSGENIWNLYNHLWGLEYSDHHPTINLFEQKANKLANSSIK